MTRGLPVQIRTFTALHLFCGIGGGALGFGAARVRLGSLEGRIENIGGIDSDPQAIEDYERLTGASGTVLDLFTAEDYRDVHGHPPPGWADMCGRLVRIDDDGWREATPADIRAACGGQKPDIVFLSAPCTGFSGLLPKARSKSAKYQALNRLVVRGLFLVMEAFDEPPRLVIMENVPRIEQRGAELIARNRGLLESYGYAVQTTIHDCGEVGGLAAHRRRWLMVARHRDRVRPFLYEPPLKPMRPLGDEILRLPLPFDPAGGPMHTLPNLQMKTWLRLALIPPGGDWRDLRHWAPGTFAMGRTRPSWVPSADPHPTLVGTLGRPSGEPDDFAGRRALTTPPAGDLGQVVLRRGGHPPPSRTPPSPPTARRHVATGGLGLRQRARSHSQPPLTSNRLPTATVTPHDGEPS